MIRTITRMALLGAVLMMLVGPRARARDVTVSLGFGGGSLFPWSAFGEVGHAFGGFALLGLDDFEVGLAGAAVYPDSRVQARFGAVWAEGRWFPFGRSADAPTGRQAGPSRTGLAQPYVALALGFATADDVPVVLAFEPVRWASSGPSPLVGVALGVRLGEVTGLFLSADFRAWNTTHGGFQLSAGYTF